MSIERFFRWVDLWVGVYIDTKKCAVYICPVPMFGVKIQRNKEESEYEAYKKRHPERFKECHKIN